MSDRRDDNITRLREIIEAAKSDVKWEEHTPEERRKILIARGRSLLEKIKAQDKDSAERAEARKLLTDEGIIGGGIVRPIFSEAVDNITAPLGNESAQRRERARDVLLLPSSTVNPEKLREAAKHLQLPRRK